MSKDVYEGGWIVETLTESPPYPAPSIAETHKFETLKAAANWLEAEVPDL
ncbi:hypothetical protein [Methylobacterium sp. NFXW15]